MAWCPECQEEYEDFVKECPECEVDLVDSLEQAKKVLLEKVSKEQGEAIKDYLLYSDIQVAVLDVEGGLQVLVPPKEYEKAMELVAIYLKEEREEVKEEDFYFDAYETEVIDVNQKVGEYRSSFYSFLLFGLLMTGLSGGQFLGLVDVFFLAAFIPRLVIGLVGLGFLAIAYTTYHKIDDLKGREEEKAQAVEALCQWYRSQYSQPLKDQFKAGEDIPLGGEYFYYMDLLTQALKEAPMDLSDSLVNTAAERLYDEDIASSN